MVVASRGPRAEQLRVEITSGSQREPAHVPSTPLGRLRIGQAKAEWCPANGKMGYGHKAPIKKSIAALETMPKGKG